MMPPADRIHPNPGQCSNKIRSVAYAKERKRPPYILAGRAGGSQLFPKTTPLSGCPLHQNPGYAHGGHVVLPRQGLPSRVVVYTSKAVPIYDVQIPADIESPLRPDVQV